MEDFIILGLDIHALEVIDIARMTGRYAFAGFISDSEDGPDTYMGYPVLGGPATLARYPSVRRVPMHTWKSRGDADKVNWINIIAPTAFVSSDAVLGSGCIIYPGCFIGAKARLGDGVFMLAGCVINHDCVIGDGAIITSGVTLAGGVTVNAGAYLGQACTIKQFLTVGAKSFVGMGAVVTRDVPDGQTVIGCPAEVYVKQ